MENKNVTFFGTDESQKNLSQFLSKIQKIEESVDIGKNKIISSLTLIIGSILNNSSEYDENCRSNIVWIGNKFLSSLVDFNAKKADVWLQLAPIFTSAYRFICELEFSITNDLNHDLSQVKQTVDDNLALFSDSEKNQIHFANLIMPTQVAKRLINHKNISDINLFNQRYDSAITMKKEWDDELDKKIIEINALKDKLDEYKTGFNFVGLYKGFNNLSTDKITEKKIGP